MEGGIEPNQRVRTMAKGIEKVPERDFPKGEKRSFESIPTVYVRSKEKISLLNYQSLVL